MTETPLIGFGQVRHTRLRPVRHQFSYANYFVLLPMRSMQPGNSQPGASAGALALNRRAALSFHDRDHGDGRGPEAGGALAWLESLLREQGIHDADGEIWLQCYPRVWGFAFKPVSFWFCHRADNSLRVIVVEVNNTFGERHCYLLDQPRFGAELSADKVFHVSPFCAVEGGYRFRFFRSQNSPRCVARIDLHDAAGALLQTSLSGSLEPISASSIRRALWRYPAMTWGVVAHIHWQALKLWLKRVPFFRKPEPPASLVTR